jgi:hypothetical protein
MRYLDSGTRDPSQTLAQWFEETINDDVMELRIQTGFFSIDAIGIIQPTLEQCSLSNMLTNVLIGSNDGSTLKSDVEQLIDIMGIPRSSANLGVVNFSGAYFHPKTYHITRTNGSQAAFVGSANLTRSGLALHVEAGIALDTQHGDSDTLLSSIALAVDSWFNDQRDGLIQIIDSGSLDDLVNRNILALAPPPRSTSQNTGTTGANSRPQPRLSPLKTLPQVRTQSGQAAVGPNTTSQGNTAIHSANQSNLPSSTRNGFPQYLLFQPNATSPTVNASALSGTSLPGGSVGLIIRLNLDSARHFMGRSGTANISIPVATISSLRFGVYGIHDRPRAEFSLKMRFISDNNTIIGDEASTNIMGYGFTPNESGHGDIRMLVPRDAYALGEEVKASGYSAPTDGDLAFLEWPTLTDPAFKISFLNSTSQLSIQARGLFDAATTAGEVVGIGACWLAPGVSPAW